jgi:hypothetical protein
MTLEEIFNKFLTGTDQDKAEVREFIRRHENMHLLRSKEFVDFAVKNAAAFGIPDSSHIEFEDEHYVEESCPHCGQTLGW